MHQHSSRYHAFAWHGQLGCWVILDADSPFCSFSNSERSRRRATAGRHCGRSNHVHACHRVGRTKQVQDTRQTVAVHMVYAVTTLDVKVTLRMSNLAPT